MKMRWWVVGIRGEGGRVLVGRVEGSCDKSFSQRAFGEWELCEEEPRRILEVDFEESELQSGRANQSPKEGGGRARRNTHSRS